MILSRRLTGLSVLPLLVAISLPAIAEDAPGPAQPPNIVFFFTDDQTTDTIGCYGNDHIQTPTIDGLAARGTRFEQSFVTHSICWVSRTTILSGLYGRSFGTPTHPDTARPDAVERLYTDHLRDAGYRTAHIGKWHAKMPKGWKAQDHFDVYQPIGRNPFYKPAPENGDGAIRHETERIVDRGIDFLDAQPTNRPFALNLWFNAGHAEDGDRRPGLGHFPWPVAVDGLYDDVTLPPPRLNDPAIFDALPDFLRTTINRERYFWRWNSPTKFQTNLRAYYRMISGIDGAIARLLLALDERGLADNTIIVYTADNGYHMGNRGLAGKWSHFDESLRVPLIVMDPRVAPAALGQVSPAPALNVDLPATFLHWAGIDVPETYQGRSLAPVVNGAPPADWRTETFHEHFAVRHRIPAFEGLRTDRYKYVRYIDDNHEFLHDLHADPDELTNLASAPEHADRLADFRARTTARIAELGGPLAPSKARSLSTPPHPISAAAVATSGARANQTTNTFVRLFDGKSLRNWTGDRKLWSVKNGILTGTTDGTLTPNRFLTWKAATVRNFDLRATLRVSPGGNSGLQYRGHCRPNFTPENGAAPMLDIVTGYQCDVIPKRPDFDGMLYEEKGRRILAPAGTRVTIAPDGHPWTTDTLPPPPAPFPAGEWRDVRVLVEGNRHRHWINDHLVVDVTDLDETNRSLDGVLAVQVHTGPAMTIEFKDFRIKHLPDDLPLQTLADAPIPEGANGVRPQGKLPKDWTPPRYSAP